MVKYSTDETDFFFFYFFYFSFEDVIITLIFQKFILVQFFTTSLKTSKATNCFKLSLKSQGSPSHEARARYRSSHTIVLNVWT